jgi:(E)-4-hydroxy-3-methylbut-2-enyl-diphosphate synthase
VTWTFDPFHPTRRRTRVVRIGDLLIGGTHPIAVQSMTTTDTLDVDDTVAQSIRLVDVGCEIVRITAPTVKAARALGEIKAKLAAKGVKVPICADIHFQPAAAMEAVKHVEKVRVNPGNYVDSKAFREREYTDEQYLAEVRRVQDAFRPLVLEAKKRGVALRIGTNHGSLSDRIMNRWGDSPRGMVESALEFVRVCEAEGLRDVVFSMKSSNPKVAIQAYRLLAKHLAEEGMDHPFHLGVTEAGEGEDGRTKSAIGIGSLLMDGIGDTIRVSLTEDPCREIPVAKRLVELCRVPRASWDGHQPQRGFDPYEFKRRPTRLTAYGAHRIGGEAPVLAAITLPTGFLQRADASERLRRMARPSAPGLPALEGVLVDREDSGWLHIVRAAAPSVGIALTRGGRPEEPSEAISAMAGSGNRGAAHQLDPLASPYRETSVVGHRAGAELAPDAPCVIDVDLPADPDDALLYGAAVAGSLLCDGIGDAVRFGGPHEPERLLEMVLGVLQACRLRASRTEYIACPGCGRTLFDLESTTQRIKARTGHLPGVKIAVMGCIVNGPGEMADADFGYVGSAPGLVNLYVGKDIVERNVPQRDADERLIALLKSHGVWREPAAA